MIIINPKKQKPIVRIVSPRLVHQEQASDFKKEVSGDEQNTKSTFLEFGKYNNENRMSTLEDFEIAEWHPEDSEWPISP